MAYKMYKVNVKHLWMLPLKRKLVIFMPTKGHGSKKRRGPVSLLKKIISSMRWKEL